MNSGNKLYESFTLGDINIIELLISYRYKYDDLFYSDTLIADKSSPMAITGATSMNEEVMLTYIALDDMINKCNFNEQQKKIIEMISEGYNYEEIAHELELLSTTINGRLKTIYKKIYKENERMWRKCIYNSKLRLKNKRCSKCKEELPATVEFFSENNMSKDGFYSICKTCRY